MIWRILAGMFNGLLNLLVSAGFALKGLVDRIIPPAEKPTDSPDDDEGMDYSLPHELVDRHGPEDDE